MPVGNDVVDLRDPHNRPAALHPRFDQRVFDRKEREALSAAPDADAGHRLRWTMWAAKESALKYFRQIEPGLPFRPREISVRLDSPTRGRVVHRGTEIEVAFDVTPARLHAVTVGAPGVVGTGVARARNPTDASTEVRRLAAHEIARLLDVPSALIEIDGSAGAAPRARLDGELLLVDLSLSHDGDWLAWAADSCPESGHSTTAGRLRIIRGRPAICRGPPSVLEAVVRDASRI